MKFDLIVLGGVAAGTSAAAAAKRENTNLKIAIFQKEPFISYGGCGLPYVLTEDVKSTDSLFAFTPEKFKLEKGVEVFINHEALSVDFDKKLVQIKNDNNIFFAEYDKLIIATGASPIKPDFGYSGEGIYYVRNPEDINEIEIYIKKYNPQNAVVIGGGFIGVEILEGLVHKKIHTTLIEGSSNLLGDIEPEIHEYFYENMKNEMLEVKFNSFVKKINKNEKFEILIDDEIVETEMIIVSIGVKPNTNFLKNSKIELLKNGAVKVDEFMRTNIKDVYSAGDCASVKHFITKEDVYIPLGTTANKQGKIAGKNSIGKNESFSGVVGSLITKFDDIEYAKTGLSYKEAISKGFDADFVVIKSRNRAGYYNGNSRIIMKLIFEKVTGRILGAQYSGKELLGRINVIVSLIYKNGTIYDLNNLDLPYSPPFSPVWDINLLAASNAIKKWREELSSLHFL